MILFALIVLLIAIVAAIVYMNRKKTVSDNTVGNSSDNSVLSTKAIFDLFLQKNGCKGEIIADDERWTTIGFMFQGGNFLANISKYDSYINLAYIGICTCDTKDVARFLKFSNQYTDMFRIFKLVTAFNEEANELLLNLHYEAYNVTYDELENAVKATISISNQLKDEVSKVANSNIEETFDRQRRQYLANLLEYNNEQTKTVQVCPSDNSLNIFSIICNLFEKHYAVGIYKVEIIKDGQTQVIEGEHAGFMFDVIPYVYDKNTGELSHNTIIVVHNTNCKYILHLNAVSQSDFTVFIRLTGTQIMEDSDEHTIPTQQPDSISCLVAYDKSTEQNQKDEFDYMWLDAQDKIQKGEENELTDEQLILLNVGKDNVGQMVYRGNKYFLSGRYFEAISILTPIYRQLKSDFFKLNKRDTNLFYEICYIIGFCYCELRQFELAANYLDIAAHGDKYCYQTEYINALTNGANLNVFYEIDKLLHRNKECLEDENLENRDMYYNFHQFLLRRRGYACIEFNDLDAAEKIFTDLLEFPESASYAQGELEYIKHLRQEREPASQNENATELSEENQ